jgi:hypothetical protein
MTFIHKRNKANLAFICFAMNLFSPSPQCKILVYNKKNTGYKAFLKGPVKNLDWVLIGTCDGI